MLNKIKLILFLSSFFPLTSSASSAEGSVGLPWEGAISKITDSISYVGYFLCVMGVVWAGYAFLLQNEKEVGFKRLIGVIIGASIIFGAKSILETLVGAHF